MRTEAITGIVLLWLFVALPAHAQEAGSRHSLIEQAASLDEQNRLDEAVEVLKKGIKADPEFAQAHIRLGYLRLKRNDNDAALSSFEKALSLRPNSPAAKTGKGIAVAGKSDLKGAEVILRDALALNPNPVRTHYELGAVYQKLGYFRRAIAEYKEGIEQFKQSRH